jgi:hypothetical protein
MGNIIASIITLPLQAFVSLIEFIFFPPKPLTPKEQLLKKVKDARRQNMWKQEENISLLASIRERDSVIRDLNEQLDKNRE